MLPAVVGFVANGCTDDKAPREKEVEKLMIPGLVEAALFSSVVQSLLSLTSRVLLLPLAILMLSPMLSSMFNAGEEIDDDIDVEGEAVVDVEAD